MIHHHVKLLRKLDFPFDFRRQEDRWSVMYDYSVDFHEEHGHFSAPHKEETTKHNCLATKQRVAYKNLCAGKKSTDLPIEERISKLVSIDFVWNPEYEAWTTRYRELTKYIFQHNRK